jgi:hypothetical protein
MRALMATALFGLATTGWAQGSGAVLQDADPATVVVNGDDWRIEIVPTFSVPARALRHHGGPVVEKPKAVLLFLGDGWTDERTAALQRSFEAAVPGLAQLSRYGVRSAATVSVQRAGLSVPEKGFVHHGGLTDLEIQAQLDRLTPRSKGSIYVLFLPESLVAFLGQKVGGEDFLAYHDAFGASDGPLRYVVVPFRQDVEQAAGAAARSFVQAVVNPEGTGWY